MSIRSKVNAVVGLAFLGAFAWYIFYSTRMVDDVRTVCFELKPGFSINSAKSVVSNYGFLNSEDATSTFPGIKDEDGSYIWIVASTMSFGEFSCIIRHNGRYIISAKMSEPYNDHDR